MACRKLQFFFFVAIFLWSCGSFPLVNGACRDKACVEEKCRICAETECKDCVKSECMVCTQGVIGDHGEGEVVEQNVVKNKIINAMNKAMDKLIKKAGNTICTFMARKIKRFEDKGEFYEEKGQYLEFTVDKNKKISLSTFLSLKISIPQLLLDFFSFDCETNELVIETRPGASQTIIPSVIKLKSVSLSLEATLTDLTNTLKISLIGDWKVGGAQIETYVDYYRDAGEIEISASPKDKKMSLPRFAKDLTGLSIPSGSVGTQGLDFCGIITSDNSVTLTLSSDKGKAKIYAIYQKEGNQASSKAFAVEFPGFQLSSLIKKVTNVDISRVPYFGALRVSDIGITFSTGEIEALPEDTFAKSKLLRNNGVAIPKGVKAYVVVPFYKDIVIMTYRDKTFTFKPMKKNLSLKKVLRFVFPKQNLGHLRLPNKLRKVFNLNVDEFSISGPRKELSIGVSYPRSIKFFKNLLVISDLSVYLTIGQQHPRVRAEAQGIINLAGAKFKTSLSMNQRKQYVLSANGDKLPVTALMRKFHTSVLPRSLSKLLRRIPFLRFSILKPTISYTLGARPLQMHIGGKPVVHGFRTVDMDIIIVKSGRRIKMVQGFQLASINLGAFMTRITGFNFRRIPLLNQNVGLSVTLSPTTFRSIHFNHGKLRGLSITKGISVQASMGFPRNCHSDTFCRAASTLIGKNARMSVQATINSPNYLPITASLSSIRLGKKVMLIRAGLRIVGGTTPSVGIVGSIKLRNPRITLAAEISVSTKGLALQLSMTNCWHNAFNAKWLSICNLLGSIAFAPTTGVSGLELGGEIRLGYKSTGRQIIAKGYIGINTVSPLENYYYVKFNRITMGSLLKAFRVNIRLPKPLAVSGFPKGFQSSFSLLGKELPQVRVSIPRGFHLKGALNILGLQGFADVTIDLPRLYDYKVALPPINVARGLLKMYASSRDRSRGPLLRAKVQLLPRPAVDIQAKGYVKVLGISIETRLRITNSKYEFFIRGKILHLFDASLYISANYGKLSSAHFHVRGSLRNDLFHRIERYVTGTLNRSAKKATAVIKVAIRKVNSKKAVFNRAIARLERARRKVNAAKHKFHRAANKVRDTRIRLHRKCRIRRCGRWSWGCKIKNAACHVFRKTTGLALRIAEKIVRSSRHFLKIANAGFIAAQFVVKTARRSLDAAKLILRGINHAYRFGVKAANMIVRYGLNGIISIRKITFDTQLGTASRGHFAAGIDVTFLRTKRVRARFQVNLRSISSMAKQLVRWVGRGITKLFG